MGGVCLADTQCVALAQVESVQQGQPSPPPQPGMPVAPPSPGQLSVPVPEPTG